MKTKISNRIYVDNPSYELYWYCYDNLIVDNPEYQTLMKLGKDKQAKRFKPKLKLYVEDIDRMIIPLGALYAIWKFIKDDPIELDFNSSGGLTNRGEMITQPLFDYQEQAVQKMIAAKGGVLVGGCGSGKTNCGIEIAHRIGKRTLWICGKRDLLKQTVERFKSLYPQTNIGTITDGDVKMGEVTISTVQTLAKIDTSIYAESFDSVIVDECFSGDTEILTENGFKRFDQLNKTELVAQYENGSISYVKPINYIQRETDKYVNFAYNGINIKVTPSHNMIGIDAKGNENIYSANYFLHHSGTDIKVITSASINVDKSQELTDMQRVMIMVQADGCLYYKSRTDGEDTYKLEFSRERKIERFKMLCEKAGIKYKEYSKRAFENAKWKDSSRFVIKMPKNANRYKVLTDFLERPRNTQYALDILNEIKEWDGHVRETNIEYDSAIKENVDFIKECAFFANVKSSVTISIPKYKNHNAIYRIYYKENKNFNYDRFETTLVEEKMNVYCVEVPTHKIVVRKDGFIFVCGNCHHCVSTPTNMKMFGRVVENIKARYKFGLTATPKRNDSLTKSMYAILGCNPNGEYEPTWTIDKKDTHTLVAEHRRFDLDTPFSYDFLNDDGTFNFNGLVDYIAFNEKRNETIVDNVVELSKAGRKQLILCLRVEQCELLNQMLNDKGVKSVLLVGKVSNKKRTEILQQKVDWDVIVGTVSLAKEGLDVVSLDTLHLVSCIANKTDTLQSVGRIERICEGKQKPIVYDYVDNNIPYLVSRYKKRAGWLKRR